VHRTGGGGWREPPRRNAPSSPNRETCEGHDAAKLDRLLKDSLDDLGPAQDPEALTDCIAGTTDTNVGTRTELPCVEMSRGELRFDNSLKSAVCSTLR